ncbi:hypothetical protein SAMD00019534_095340 [Acytostelium subglobosum LB1]|uniref:hypothetical protein n=1 Tax=Acytostelium subglobosum LB1 TaxID=1410327 RepID=UPI000644B639|nr:hypothetical protein SAMD00019534_095340 [Acytostelium subglobosum LB1]GAM26359.1 hypothetical protein SAMD00019534_095340 [Acytostelium subglobosum LB1]|eukprot:XP_012750913.1 hypothetical protein SAMD00019534_095340 [Acytostelium subglobosum LB1]
MVPDLLHVLVAVIRTYVKNHFKWLETWLKIEVDGNRVGKRVKERLLGVMARLGPKIPVISTKHSASKPSSLVARWEATRVKFQAAIDITLRRNDMFNLEDLLAGENEELKNKYDEYKERALDTWRMLHHFFSTMIEPGTAPAIRNAATTPAAATHADATPAAATTQVAAAATPAATTHAATPVAATPAAATPVAATPAVAATPVTATPVAATPADATPAATPAVATQSLPF